MFLNISEKNGETTLHLIFSAFGIILEIVTGFIINKDGYNRYDRDQNTLKATKASGLGCKQKFDIHIDN